MITFPDIKINLGLNVLSRREDGYHNLETLFIPCNNFTDTLEIVRGDDWSRTLSGLKNAVQAISEDGKLMITISREEGVDWDPLKDLSAKAYFLLQKDFDLPPMKIVLQKHSPVGAGLGGGSADAAFALRMISSLAGLDLPDSTLESYAACLGSDCALFISNRPAFGSGRGEILEPFPLDVSRFQIRIVIPEGISVSTVDAYRGIVPSIPEKPLREVLLQDPATWKDELKNDFETTVFRKFPVLAGVKEQLYREGALYASMSGSGSAMFSLSYK